MRKRLSTNNRPWLLTVVSTAMGLAVLASSFVHAQTQTTLFPPVACTPGEPDFCLEVSDLASGDSNHNHYVVDVQFEQWVTTNHVYVGQQETPLAEIWATLPPLMCREFALADVTDLPVDFVGRAVIRSNGPITAYISAGSGCTPIPTTTSTGTATAPPTAISTLTPTQMPTATSTTTTTSTPTPTATPTQTGISTQTSTPTATSGLTATATRTPTTSATASGTTAASSTPSATPTAAPPQPSIFLPLILFQFIDTNTSTPTSSPAVTLTPPPLPTITPTATPTMTLTPTSAPTITPTVTSTPTMTPAPTVTICFDCHVTN